MPLYEVTLEQSYFGQQVINRWNYQSGAIPAGQSGAFLCLVGMGFAPFGEIEAFGEGTIAGLLQERQVDDAIFVQAIARNIYSDTDFYTYAFPANTTGADAANEGLSPTMAVGFTSDKTRYDIRRAQKRFTGISETSVVTGGILSGAAEASFQLLGDAMADINLVPVGGGSAEFTPYIFGRLKYHPPGKTTWAYKYYLTEAEQLENIARINQFTVKKQIRTQTSRQYGRGS